MALCIIDFIGGNGLLDYLGEWGVGGAPWPKWHSLCSCHLRAQECPGPPPPPLALVIHSPL
jgi:hypothetical protein